LAGGRHRRFDNDDNGAVSAAVLPALTHRDAATAVKVITVR
jgi:hypothetical protein